MCVCVCVCVERGGRVKEVLQALLTSRLDATDCLALGFGRHNTRGISSFTCWKGGWLIHSAVVDGSAKTEVSLLYYKSKVGRVAQSV